MLSLIKFPALRNDDSEFNLIAQECVQQSARNIISKQLQVVIDVDSPLPGSFDLGWLKQAILKMLKLAIERSPYRSQIELTACRVEDAVELEVADDGETSLDISRAFRHANCQYDSTLSGEFLASVQARGAEFWGTSCPQGGMAWTLRMPQRAALAKAA